MKKLVSLLLILVFAFSFASCASSDTVKDLEAFKKSGVLRVGMECNYAPFNWLQATPSDTAVAVKSGGYADGYDVQIAKIIAAELGLTLEIYPMEWEGLTLALTSGTIDCIIAGMSPTAERKLTIDFSNNYYESTLVMVVKKDGAYANATALTDFANAKITGQLNTFHYDVINQIENVNKQTALGSFPLMIVALQSGTVDGYVSELPGAVSAVSANSDLTYVQFAEGKGFNTSTDDTAIAVGLRKNSDATAEINKILSSITSEKREELMNSAVANQPVIVDEK